MHEGEPWRHPQATHSLVLQGRRLDYVLHWAQRRSTGLRVTTQGLQVRAPRSIGLAGVEAVLHEKAGWIARQLQRLSEQSEALPTAPVWEEGMLLPYLGGHLRLKAADGAFAPGLQPCMDEETGVSVMRLALCVPSQPAPMDWQRAAWAWWQMQARRDFSERLNRWAPAVGVYWRALQLSQARTRWGSAYADGRILLNVRLLHCAPALVDYVVVHELAHLRFMDHSPQFWAVVAGVMADYRERRQALPRCELPFWNELPVARSHYFHSPR